MQRLIRRGDDAREPLLLGCGQPLGDDMGRAPRAQDGGSSARGEREHRREPQQQRAQGEGGAEQDEIPVARDEVVANPVVAVAGLQALSDQETQVARQRRVGIVDGLVLAHQAAQPGGDASRPGLERRIGEGDSLTRLTIPAIDVDGLGQARKFFERVLDTPRVAILVDSNEERVFFWFTGVCQ